MKAKILKMAAVGFSMSLMMSSCVGWGSSVSPGDAYWVVDDYYWAPGYVSPGYGVYNPPPPPPPSWNYRPNNSYPGSNRPNSAPNNRPSNPNNRPNNGGSNPSYPGGSAGQRPGGSNTSPGNSSSRPVQSTIQSVKPSTSSSSSSTVGGNRPGNNGR